MALNYYPQEEEFEVDEWYAAYDSNYQIDGASAQLPFDIITLSAALLVIIGLVVGLRFLTSSGNENVIIRAPDTDQRTTSEMEGSPVSPPLLLGPTTFISPYDHYILTQGIHGQSYGHMAIDIAAGKGETIKSPIEGEVKELYFDEIGNPILVIENDYYEVTLLHGNYTVGVGDRLSLGQPVGTEGNLGNTRDMQGRSCRNRDCGYHTHLNVFDKKAGINTNPLELIGD
ncbi:MAG: M23 family metallopeptidase [Candidatus Promineifilaceae bacterium]|nr:M23 family metallopeptidase [Candidatus Promineifilaceae bacterium]